MSLTVYQIEHIVEVMDTDEDSGERPFFAIPTLMRAARGTYSRSIRAQIRAIGVDDLPRNGIVVMTGIDTVGGPGQNLPRWLGVSKQAVSQVVDTLVNRGYLERSPDPDDRRRNSLEITQRGREVLDAAYLGVEAVESQLGDLISPEQFEAMRAGLYALAQIKEADEVAGTGVRRPRPMLRKFEPIFPVRDLGAALAHYRDLGFDSFAYEEGADYGFANRDGKGIHLQVKSDHPDCQGTTYLYVRDADALYEEWSRPGIKGRTLPVGTMDYAMREGTHIDPDGNVIRFGSDLAQ
jgi:DNA-binding MarR family transcriptional regulator